MQSKFTVHYRNRGEERWHFWAEVNDKDAAVSEAINLSNNPWCVGVRVVEWRPKVVYAIGEGVMAS